MKILQTKVRGLNSVEDTKWFSPHERLTVLTGAPAPYLRGIARALEAINPLSPVNQNTTLTDYPQYRLVRGHKKRVIPEKRTAAYSVFSAPAELVKQLSSLDPCFFETDRIEVGRRLDLTRWVSFVEMSAATRWKSFLQTAEPLLCQLSAGQIEEFYQIEKNYRENDRIKGDFAKKLDAWWQQKRNSFPGSSQKLQEKCHQQILLDQHFHMARRHVETQLPFFIAADLDGDIDLHYSLESFSKENNRSPLHLLLRQIIERENSLGLNIEQIESRLAKKIADIERSIGADIALPQIQLRDRACTIIPHHTEDTITAALGAMLILSLVLCPHPPVFLLYQADNSHSTFRNDSFFASLGKLSRLSQTICATPDFKPSETDGSKVIDFSQVANSRDKAPQ